MAWALTGESGFMRVDITRGRFDLRVSATSDFQPQRRCSGRPDGNRWIRPIADIRRPPNNLRGRRGRMFPRHGPDAVIAPQPAAAPVLTLRMTQDVGRR